MHAYLSLSPVTDECTIDNGGCEEDCSHKTNGAVVCLCAKGFRLAEDDKQCNGKLFFTAPHYSSSFSSLEHCDGKLAVTLSHCSNTFSSIERCYGKLAVTLLNCSNTFPSLGEMNMLVIEMAKLFNGHVAFSING